MTTTIVNMKTDKCDVSIGRHPKGHVPKSGRGMFGNPFPMPKYTREECIELFRPYFYERLKDPVFKAAVESLRGKRLGCFCKPLACHGDVIKEYLDASD